MNRPVPAPTGRAGYLDRALLLVGALVLTILFFSPVTEAMSTGLDSSNYGSYSYFTAKEFQFGTQVVPMAGPYGFVPYGFTYAGYLFSKRLAVELLTKLSLAVLVIWFFRRTPGRPVLRALWLVATVFLSPLSTDGPYILAILLSGLFLVENHLRTDARSLRACLAAAAFLALLTLFKGTQTMLAGATLGLLTLQAVYVRQFRRLAWIVAAYAVALLLLLLIAGQNPLNLPAYMHGVLELASGYNAAMSLDEPGALLRGGIILALILAVLIALAVCFRRRDPVALAGALYIAGFTFIAWKHGFVRADGHVAIFFQFACTIALTIPLFLAAPEAPPAPRWVRPVLTLLALVAAGLAVRGDASQPWQRYVWLADFYQQNIARTLQQLTSPAQAKAEADAMLARERHIVQFSNLPALVGQAPVDFFGYEQGYVMLNRLNYRPRPMGGGNFNVFTPALQQANVAHVMDATRRPEYFLFNLLTIDDRYLAQDDAGTLRVLLANYAPCAAGYGLPVLKALPGPPQLPTPQLVQTAKLAWDQAVTVPEVPSDRMLLVSFDLPLNLHGRLRAFLYKPPLVFMDMAGTAIERPTHRRIIPSMFHDPVPLNPLLEGTDDLLALYEGRAHKKVTQLTLRTAGPACYEAAQMSVRFYTIPRPPVVPPPTTILINSATTREMPFVFESQGAPLLRQGDFVAQIMIPPGRIGYRLNGDENILRFVYGMADEVYDKETDGVDFSAEIVRPGQAPQIIFRRNLAPRTRPGDRGIHVARVPLPPFPAGSELYLRTGRGPDNDGNWDLGYYSRIDLHRGPYIADQFPGFATVPQEVNADMCGGLEVGDRTVFMLSSPGALTFALTGREKKLHFAGGLLAGAYTGAGGSDGVEFLVDLREADGTTRRLFHYYLNPRKNPADREDRSFDVDLPALAAGSTLIVAISPGPAGDRAWDWSYVSALRLE